MLWLNLLILVLLAAGHTELLVTFTNRLHSLPIARAKLRRFRRIEDAIIVAFPVALLWFVGLHGAAVLDGGSWANVSSFWSVYLALCAIGFVGQCWSIVRWHLRRAPAVQLSNHSRTVDVARQLGHKPIGTGPRRLMASLPGNEVFRVQVSDKRFALPRVPAEWHGLSILHITDTHFVGTPGRPFFEEIARLGAELRPDLVVFTGDLLDDLSLLNWLPETFGQLRAPLGRYYVLGNHDWFFGAPEIRAEFDRCHWEGVAGRTVSVSHRGRVLEIGGSERPWMGNNPAFATRHVDFRLLLSHSPDQFHWARRRAVDLVLAGHNHGGQIVLPMIGPVFAPSRHGVRYAAGAYWSDPTLLYVSRGLSGRTPLRFNCLPELTQIILESPAVRAADEHS